MVFISVSLQLDWKLILYYTLRKHECAAMLLSIC